MAATAPIPHPAPSPAPRAIPKWIDAFRPPRLLPVSNRAFRFHMSYTLCDAVSAGIMANAPLMAVKALNASDAQLQIPIGMTCVGLFASLFTGAAMATRRKKPFVVVPGMALAASILAMAWTQTALWFLIIAGVVSVFDFALRPAFPSVLRIVYPDHCRAHVAGTLRQYAAVVFLVATLLSSSLLEISGGFIQQAIRLELTLAGLASFAAFSCFARLPDVGDGSREEAFAQKREQPPRHEGSWWSGFTFTSMVAWRDPRFVRYLATLFLFASGNLFYMGIVPAFFARDLHFGYFKATLLMHIVPGVTAFVLGGWLAAWFDRTSIWYSFAAVALLWGLDPVLLGTLPFLFPAVFLARILRGPATVGSMVLTFFTGVHSFARPGPDTSRYMAAQLFVNGLARFVAPAAAASVLAAHWSRQSILVCGGLAVLTASMLFFIQNAWSTSDGLSDNRLK